MAKDKSPAFQFYPDSWLSSTDISLMTPAEEGAYIRLLCHAWLQPDCGLPDDDEQLALLSRLGKRWHRGSGAVVRRKFDVINGRVYNLRLLEERKKQERWSQKSSEGGKRSAEKRWGTDNQTVTKEQPPLQPPLQNVPPEHPKNSLVRLSNEFQSRKTIQCSESHTEDQADDINTAESTKRCKGGFQMVVTKVVTKEQPNGNSPSPSPSPNKTTPTPPTEDLRSERNDEDSLFSVDDPPFNTLDEAIKRTAKEIHGRHPARKCAVSKVQHLLRRIVNAVPKPERLSTLDYINGQHKKMAVSGDWNREGRTYCKGLAAYLNPENRYWENDPIRPEHGGSTRDDPYRLAEPEPRYPEWRKPADWVRDESEPEDGQ